MPRAPELGSEKGGHGGDRIGRSGISNAQYEKCKATGADVYEGGEDTEGVDDGHGSADMEEERGCA